MQFKSSVSLDCGVGILPAWNRPESLFHKLKLWD
jgi:hypothetical protein